MPNINDRVKELNKTIIELKNYLVEIKKDIEQAESKGRSEIGIKEKELEGWRRKLETCQQERNQIKKEIRERVLELEKSDLANSEKQAKIIQLLTGHNEELEEVDNLLYEERGQYRSIRDKLIGKLCEPCQGCQEKNKILKEVNKKVNGLLAVICGMIILFFIFHVWFIWFAWRKKKKKRDVVSMFRKEKLNQ